MYRISEMSTNPQSGSASSSSSGDIRRMNRSQLPPLFVYMETGDWARAMERAKKHPREVKTWASIRSKSSSNDRISGAKRLALHHACFKLRSSVSSGSFGSTSSTYDSTTDAFIEVCNLILLLIELYPDAAGMRESRHGCLPLHLAAFASCTLNSTPSKDDESVKSEPSTFSLSTLGNSLPVFNKLGRPSAIRNNNRSQSEATTMTAGFLEERFTGNQTDQKQAGLSPKESNSTSVSMGPNFLISEKREEAAVKVLNALLDAYPRGSRMDSEGGRLPLHTACAGRATPLVVATLIRANPSAARHRNKDGFLPLHLSAHWGISHPNVATSLLKAYPDATFGRNRWERTPLEEALCMAGENGRPHQASLVRALRKHPSYWTRPAEFIKEERKKGRQIVDIDDMDDETCMTEDYVVMQSNSRGSPEVKNNSQRQNADLHSLMRDQEWELVMSKLETSPLDAEEELKVTTRGGFTSTYGFTPLHYACERHPPQEVVEALIAACPSAVAKRTMPGGALPLHIACTWHASVEVIGSLLNADKSTCKVQDELGNLPLHSAAFSGISTPVVERLLRTYSKASLARNHQGSLPEEIVKRLRHDNRKEVMGMLMIAREEIMAKRDDKNHRRNKSDGAFLTSKRSWDKSEEQHQQGVEVPYTKDDAELVWV
ncbi:unnamed protein product [Cylindrotheca closterium]|uniref:Uncharacterized protein n=1 Tax=Cylindrotheca closterium TaxID=2856 RepID=A0AAD2CEH6_9STRA|nr:unnamed protein product [Cylindrotheca closterium]